MADRKRPLFLDRSLYRQTRLRDAARLLPVFGAVLFILPLLWAAPDETARQTSNDVIYFFGLWLAMIVIAAALAPGLSDGDAEKAADPDRNEKT